jgi:16S rRNA (adenine1518-N6/adenine1519-N6)-dimethyltransferase|tara:strand:- start:765 stop:1547 length:783 start_codon:yes stop_codon:yes gene_type:complete
VKIRAKKSLGQNFLFDKNILKIITDCSEITDKNILEVGPGTGNLTNEILNKNPKNILLIEKDKILIEILKKKFSEKITFINKDILNIDENLLSKDKLVVFGNLPYNISTEILTKWILNLNSKIWFEKLILMFQKEVADRIISKVDKSSYGRLTIISNWKLNIKKIIDIKPNSFHPKPKVESTLLVFTPKKKYFKLRDSKTIEKVTRVFFNQRRKKIKKPFNQLFDQADLVAKKLNINLDLRPQNLSYNDYYLIAKELEKL